MPLRYPVPLRIGCEQRHDGVEFLDWTLKHPNRIAKYVCLEVREYGFVRAPLNPLDGIALRYPIRYSTLEQQYHQKGTGLLDWTVTTPVISHDDPSSWLGMDI
jgi:hypothetical protein